MTYFMNFDKSGMSASFARAPANLDILHPTKHGNTTIHETTTVSAKYIGLSDKSSKNWFGPVKFVIGPVKNWQFWNSFLTVYGKDEVQDGKMSSKRFGLFAETGSVALIKDWV